MYTDIQRVKKAVDWLIFENVVENRRDLAEKTGYTESSMSQILNGKVALSLKFIKNLSKMDCRLSVEWLQTGEGEMLIPDSAESPAKIAPPHTVGLEDIFNVVQRLTATSEATAASNDKLAASNAKLVEQLAKLTDIVASQNKEIENLSKKKDAEGANSAAQKEAHG